MIAESKLKMLVAITSFGDRNLEMLRRVIRNYQNLPYDVDVVVCSDGPKELGPQVKVLAGLPTKDPWSLPFAHKPVFAENQDRYDLFVYTEDDIELTGGHIESFLRATPQLAADEIAGFQLYEVDKAGNKTLPGVHGAFRWKPDSVKQRGDYFVADFTNEHSAFYMLTRSQMKRVVASGGYLRPPCEGRFDIACTASTDPYVNCGLRKVMCISAIDDFLLHHLPDKYAGRLGISLAMFKDQIQTLMRIHEGAHPGATLCGVESKLVRQRWSKNVYELPDDDLLSLVPRDAATILSIGCGWGATEAKLKERGARVTALPVDSVLGAVAARQGLEMVYGSMTECLDQIIGRQFDCVVMTNLLHLLPDPEGFLDGCAGLVAAGGTLVLRSPNLTSLKVQVKRALGRGDFSKLVDYEQSGISVFSAGKVAKSLARSGFRVKTVHLPNGQASADSLGGLREQWRALSSLEWILQARRQ